MNQKKYLREGVIAIVNLLLAILISYIGIAMLMDERHIQHWNGSVRPFFIVISFLLFHFLDKKRCTAPTRFLERSTGRSRRYRRF